MSTSSYQSSEVFLLEMLLPSAQSRKAHVSRAFETKLGLIFFHFYPLLSTLFFYPPEKRSHTMSPNTDHFPKFLTKPQGKVYWRDLEGMSQNFPVSFCSKSCAARLNAELCAESTELNLSWLPIGTAARLDRKSVFFIFHHFCSRVLFKLVVQTSSCFIKVSSGFNLNSVFSLCFSDGR